jgi:hypothetical protein
VEITTRQLAKCKWNLELASNFLNLLTSLASIFSSSQLIFFPANLVLFLPDSETQTHTWHNNRNDFGKFFSDLASKKFELLASLASAFKILIPPLCIHFCIMPTSNIS